MTRRILIVFALVLLSAISVLADERDMLLAEDGTLFTIETVWVPDAGLVSVSNSVLMLTTRRGTNVVPRIVPATFDPGTHSHPALAYDSVSKRLFVFWQRATNTMSGQLLFTSIDEAGTWGPTTAIEPARSRPRNLRIGVTRTIETVVDGKKTILPEVNVHATWWDESWTSEEARYAMLTIEKGQVTSVQVRRLADFVDSSTDRTYSTSSDFNPELLRHPSIFESPAHDTVDVVFGDLKTNGFHRIKLRPGSQARIRIPIGAQHVGFGPPSTGTLPIDETSVGAFSGGDDRMVFYFRSKDTMDYVVYRNAAWSSLRSLGLDEKLTSEVAIEAIRRMVNAE